MKTMNCDIIQDLIPSYVDGICSATSHKCVEEHIKTCENCKKVFELCRNTSFSGMELEQKELNGMKKVKNHLQYQQIFSYLLLLFLTLMGLYIFQLNANHFSLGIYYGVFVLCLLDICLFTIPHGQRMLPGKKQYPIAITSLGIIMLNICLLVYSIHCVQGNQIPFQLEPFQIGPLLSTLLGISFLIQLAFLAILLLQVHRRKIDCRWLLCLVLTGLFLLLFYRWILSNMSAPDSFWKLFVHSTLIICGIGLLSTILNFVLAIKNGEGRI